jgi:hypothetical protein
MEVVANQMRILDRAPKNRTGAKAGEPVDESDNPFNEPGHEATNEDAPSWVPPKVASGISPP